MRLQSSLQIILFFLPFGQAVAQTCSINVTSMAFGSLEYTQGATIDSTGSISVNCDPQVSYIIRLDAGRNSSGSYLAREMRLIDGMETMKYNLYRDSARTQVWGDGTGGSLLVSGISTGISQNITVYGRIYGGQNLHVGSYMDSVTVIIEW